MQTQTPGVAPAVNNVATTYGAQINSRLQNPYQQFSDFLKSRGTGSPTDIAPDAATKAAIDSINSLWGGSGGAGGGGNSRAMQFAMQNWKTYFPGDDSVPRQPQWDALPQYLKDEAIKATGGAESTPGGFDINTVLNAPGAAATPGVSPVVGPTDIGDISPTSGLSRTSGITDTEGAYGKSLDAANRQFTQYLLPQMLESYGRRGGRYSSAIADAGARSYGDIQANLGAEAAKARIAATEANAGRVLTADEGLAARVLAANEGYSNRKLSAGESFANRSLTANETYAQRIAAANEAAQARKQTAALAALQARMGGATTLSNIGIGNTALAQANQAKDYQEFLRYQPDAYFGAAQNFLNTRPIYPQVITGGQPVLTQNPSQLDAVNQYLNAISNIAPAVSTAANLFR